ncbi:MAG TPA: PD-(D/E)XK nuclease-like domain-containing protein [Burkholderiales bacterium]|nr:PD-(D/E)XK nuclease-like domain-containing protein [Burkholderiales bacterium]
MRTIDDLVRDRTTERRGGAVRQEPLDAYLARVDHVSASALRRSLHTAERAAALRIEDDPSQRLAQALHALVLEPARFAREYFVLDRDAPTPSGDEQPDAPAGRVWLSSGEYAALVSSRDAIRAYPRAPLARWLDEGMKELSIYWTDDAGRRWKARPDCFTDEIVLELKTTGDVRPRAFARTRRRFGYDLKAAHYVDAARHLTGRAPRFAFIAVELTPPHYVWLYELSAAELARAGVELAAARSRFYSASR